MSSQVAVAGFELATSTTISEAQTLTTAPPRPDMVLANKILKLQFVLVIISSNHNLVM